MEENQQIIELLKQVINKLDTPQQKSSNRNNERVYCLVCGGVCRTEESVKESLCVKCLIRRKKDVETPKCKNLKCVYRCETEIQKRYGYCRYHIFSCEEYLRDEELKRQEEQRLQREEREKRREIRDKEQAEQKIMDFGNTAEKEVLKLKRLKEYYKRLYPTMKEEDINAKAEFTLKKEREESGFIGTGTIKTYSAEEQK